jgi:hypothetical protein
MTRIVRWRPSPALVIACIALLLALGGVSYGLATGAIDSREIKNNTIRSRDVRIGALRGRDISGAGRSLAARCASQGSAPCRRGFGRRPQSRADRQTRPGGDVHPGNLRARRLIINATCTGAGDLSLSVTTAVNNSTVPIANVHAGGGIPPATRTTTTSTSART